ncbi:MAG: MarR family transcriptional regulator [Ruminococcaceae bacterium]|nr:MarR family transcriptional regulator [Oscillospiraceae bacterium]
MNPKPLPEEFFESLPKRRLDKHYNAMMRIHDAAKLYHDRLRRQSEHDGLPSSYRMLIYHLARMKPGVTQLDLVKAAHLKPPTISVTLQKMERDGLVIRRDNEDDLRQTLVYLTDKGKAIDDKIRVLHEEGDAVALSGLSDDEISVLSELLNRVIDNLIEDRE